jgi:hypothetical protein
METPPFLGILSNVSNVARKITRPIHVTSISRWDSGFGVFGVVGKATKLMSTECPNYLFLYIPL